MKKILVIEDNEEVCENLEEIFEFFGYQVIIVEDGKVGVEKVLINLFDFILCDVMMFYFDGFGVFNIFSKKSVIFNVLFIFFIVKMEKLDFCWGMNFGADDYVIKFFYKDELFDVIEICLEKSEWFKKQFDKIEQGFMVFINEVKGYEEF